MIQDDFNNSSRKSPKTKKRLIQSSKIAPVSYFKTSTGKRISKKVIDRRVTKAKKDKLEQQREDNNGYNFCETCERSSGVYLDCSHIVSVDECQKSGQAELAWDIKNIKILCRICHQKKDRLNLQFNTF